MADDLHGEGVRVLVCEPVQRTVQRGVCQFAFDETRQSRVLADREIDLGAIPGSQVVQSAVASECVLLASF